MILIISKQLEILTQKFLNVEKLPLVLMILLEYQKNQIVNIFIKTMRKQVFQIGIYMIDG